MYRKFSANLMKCVSDETQSVQTVNVTSVRGFDGKKEWRNLDIQ
jgi:hypothetical protein